MKVNILKQWYGLLLVGVLCSSGVVWADAPASLSLGLTRVFDSVPLNRPVLLVEAPILPERVNLATTASRIWYVVEQAGQVRRLQQTGVAVKDTLFIGLRKRVDSGPNEAGLLGMALDPQFAQNGRVYLSYTRRGARRDGASLVSVLSRFVSRDAGHTLDAGSEQVLLEVAQPYGNHNGGNLQFGPEGYLYFGLGDGGSAGDPQGNGQNTQTLLGALLRLDVRGDGAYQIPADNPFSGEGGLPEIYAYGLRNPWRWSFDRETGNLWLADVGQNKWEEVNIITPGGNYGWNLREGMHCYAEDCQRTGLIDPLAEYSHNEGCSITGGYVYRGKDIPALSGVYLFADYCSGKLWGLFRDGTQYTRRLLLESKLNIASFGEDRLGEVYVIDLGGKLFRLTKGAKN